MNRVYDKTRNLDNAALSYLPVLKLRGELRDDRRVQDVHSVRNRNQPPWFTTSSDEFWRTEEVDQTVSSGPVKDAISSQAPVLSS